MSKVRICRCGCGKTATFVCSDCKSAAYYSADCQKRDWPIHRQVCFAETGLDVPSEETPKLVGVVFELRNSAVPLTEAQLRSLGESAKKILASPKYVSNGIYCLSVERFDKDIGEPKSSQPYFGVRAEKGAIYLRGREGTREFEESMRNLSRIGDDVSAQSYLIYQNYEFMSEAMGSIEEILDDPRYGSIDAKMELLAILADMVLLVERIPGYADLLNTAHWVVKMQKFAAERAKMSGTQVTEYSHQIERVLDGVWSRVDVGLYLNIPEDMRRIQAIPLDLLRRCRKLTLPQMPIPATLDILRKLPNLTSVKLSEGMLGTGPRMRFDKDQTGMLFSALPKSIEKLAIGSFCDLYVDFDWVTSDRFPRLRKLQMWTPRSTKDIPNTVEDLILNPRANSLLREMNATVPLKSVKKLKLDYRELGHLIGADDAPVVVAAFPNLESLEIESIMGADTIGFLVPLMLAMPYLVDLWFNAGWNMFSELMAYLRTLTEHRLRSLRMVKKLAHPGDISETDRDTLAAFASSGVVKKLGLCMGAEAILTLPIRAQFDVLDVDITRQSLALKFPPARVLRVTGGVLNIGNLLNPGSRPKGLIMADARTHSKEPQIPEGALSELVSLSCEQALSLEYMDEWLNVIMGAAPKLKYLGIEVMQSRGQIHERETPIVHIPIDTLCVKMLNRVDPYECLSNLIRTIESPRKLIIDTVDWVVDSFLIQWIISKWHNVRTVCVTSSVRGIFPNKKFYPVNLFTREDQALLHSKVKDLMWFTDPWNHEFDKF